MERLDLLKALVNDHVVLTSGGVHSSADTGDVTAIPNAIYSGGIDYATAILLINDDLRTKLIAHMGSGTYHAAADTVNLVTVGAMTVTGFNTLINEMITKYPTHRQHHLSQRRRLHQHAQRFVGFVPRTGAGGGPGPVYPDAGPQPHGVA